MYKFLKVEGIDNVNTPLFETLQEQKSWFNSKAQVIIDDIFPPYYTNVISVSSDELDFKSDVNYVELIFNNKSYYYFIESTAYVNEDVIDITLRMDTIQTYMFDIEYTNARVRRKTIKRWNSDGTINRDYIRENFGNNIMIDKAYNDYATPLYDNGFSGWIVGKMVKDNIFGIAKPSVLKINNKKYNDGCTICLLPALMFNSNIRDFTGVNIEYYKNGTQQGTVSNETMTLQALHELQEDPNMIDIYYVPRQVFKNIQFIYISSTHTIQIHYNDDFDLKVSTLGTYSYLTTNNAEILSNTHIIDFNFFKNESEYAFFSYMFCPQLLDENYVECLYGERITTTSYPLSKMTNTKLYCKNTNDILTGYRNYWLVENVDDNDKYLTLKTIATKETYPMINDYWKQYVANNKGSIVIGSSVAMLKSAVDVSTAFASRGKKLFTKTTGRITKKGQRVIDAVSDNDLMDTIQENINKQFAPETLTQGNEVTNDVLSNALNEISIIREVSNIDYVATIYESIGYRVDEFIVGSPISQDRKYYNYVECDDMDIRLTCLSIENALDDIKDRYNQGIRYFNMDAMSSVNLKLGDICVYDNIEL